MGALGFRLEARSGALPPAAPVPSPHFFWSRTASLGLSSNSLEATRSTLIHYVGVTWFVAAGGSLG